MLVSVRSGGSPLRITSIEKDEPVADVRDFCYLLRHPGGGTEHDWCS